MVQGLSVVQQSSSFFFFISTALVRAAVLQLRTDLACSHERTVELLMLQYTWLKLMTNLT